VLRKLFSPPSQRGELFLYLLICVALLCDAWRLLDQVAVLHPQTLAGLRLDRLVVASSALLLVGLGLAAFRRGTAGNVLAFAIGAVCGLMFFARTLGFALADPAAIGWLLNADWAQHYSGWAMFRQAPWSWPPGLLPEVWYPVGTSIVYTDSLPLLAFLLKPFAAWLPEPFQYIGIWLLLNCVLQGGFGALLIARTSRAPAAILAGAALFVFAPIFINRIGHDTLTAHWLLLAALWLYFRSARPSRLVSDASPWWLITALASLVHPYLAAMTLAIQAGHWWKLVGVERMHSTRQAMTAVAVSLVIAACMWWLSGAAIIRESDGAGGIPYGQYSFNLLGFFNPMFFSRLLPTLPSLPGQYEGFAYLGAGMLALGLLVAADALRKHRLAVAFADWKPLAIISLVLLVFAASSVFVIGSWVVIDLPIKSSLLGIFRSSGRFIWVAYYSLMLLIVCSVLRRLRPLLAAGVLATILVVQMVDFSTAHARYAVLRAGANVAVPEARLDDPRWQVLAEGRSHLTLLPPIACGKQAGPYLPFLLFAASHGMTLNSGYLARWNRKATGRYCEDLGKQVDAAAWSKDDLYVIGADWKARFERQAPTARCETLNGYDVCVVEGTTPRPQ
jgi:uncharacterized protein DUF6311